MPTKVVIRSCESCRTSDTCEAEHRRATDIGTEAEHVHEARIDGRYGKSGDRREEDRVDVVERQPCAPYGSLDCARSETGSHLDEGIVRAPEVTEVVVGLKRK